jgi:hypothetical protein
VGPVPRRFSHGAHHHDPRLVIGAAATVFGYPSTVASTYCNVALLRMG